MDKIAQEYMEVKGTQVEVYEFQLMKFEFYIKDPLNHITHFGKHRHQYDWEQVDSTNSNPNNGSTDIKDLVGGFRRMNRLWSEVEAD